MTLQLFNTLTRKKEEFKPIEEGKVRIYSCGPTVYDYAHIGNFRAYICADILRRWLEYRKYTVKHVMNITDVDDKTIKNSQEQKVSLKEYTEKFTKAFFEDLEKLNIEKAHEYPRATDHIKEMVEITQELIKKGFAYKGDDGSIYYNVKKKDDYGKLSKIKVDELKAGARVSQDEYEKDQVHDFALWKAWVEEDGDVFWETDIGKGRPGWHIECSAMSSTHLGKHFDIHTGGIDLIFPHHENEIAQSEGCFEEQCVNYWVHNEWLLVDGKKMSKSLGNFFTLRDLIHKGYKPEAIRYLLLSQHYKLQMNFTEEGIVASQAAIDRLNELVRKLQEVRGEDGEELIAESKKEFEEHMDDDLDVSPALASLFEFVRKANHLIGEKKLGKKGAMNALSFLKEIDSILGVMAFDNEEIPTDVQELATKREEARKNKDWKTSDKIRDELKEKGYRIDDTPEGPRMVKE